MNYKNSFEWPHSIQSDLFAYLKPEQQEFVKPILRVLKKPAQIELCCSLLDYMEGVEADPMNDMVLDVLFAYLTRTGILADCNDPSDKRIIRPLKCSKVSGSNSVGEPSRTTNLLRHIFPFFKD